MCYDCQITELVDLESNHATSLTSRAHLRPVELGRRA